MIDEGSFISFGSPAECKGFLERHRAFFERSQNLNKALRLAFDRTIVDHGMVDRVIFSLGIVCVEDFSEMMVLCGNGYGIGAMKLIRGMYERAVTAWYLHDNPNSAQDFLDFHWVTMRKLSNSIKTTFGPQSLPEDWVQEVEKQYNTVKRKFTGSGTCCTKRTWSGLDFVSMAHQTSSLSNLIEVAYRLPSEQIHSTAGAILARLQGQGSTSVFKNSIRRDEADRYFKTAHQILLQVLELQRQHFRLDDLEPLLKTCFQDFADIWHTVSREKH